MSQHPMFSSKEPPQRLSLLFGLGVGAIVAVALVSPVRAQKTSTPSPAPKSKVTAKPSRSLESLIEDISIYGEKRGSFSEAGSLYRLPEMEIRQKRTSDVHQVLRGVPGVYLQEEDAFGLRPNVGFRGAHPHRSKKITLMEDGILIAPAPYSAPAAYFFPLVDTSGGLEVYKGASSAMFGPNSIGGSLNLTSSPLPTRTQQHVRTEWGSFDNRMIHLKHGQRPGPLAFEVQTTYLGSKGFKQLPNNESTGFDKLHLGFRSLYSFGPDQLNSIETKFGYSLEESRETYLGLNDEDFSINPYQRYSASSLDNMKAEHQQYQLRYNREWGLESFLSLTTYHHRFRRNWTRLNGFATTTWDPERGFKNSAIKLSDVVAQPLGSYSHYYEVLKGQIDSSFGDDHLLINHNDRLYISQGLQLSSSVELGEWGSGNPSYLHWGARLHQDSVDRNHAQQRVTMQGGRLLETSGLSKDPQGQNVDQATSTSGYVRLESQLGITRWDLTTRWDGVRTERRLEAGSAPSLLSASASSTNYEKLFTPAVSVTVELTENTRSFAGVHKGMNLIGPGQGSDLRQEESVNYELGLKGRGSLYWEAIGFYSDYKNIVSLCSASTGCSSEDQNKKFNGGRAAIYGLETSFGTQPYWRSVSFPTQVTLTQSQAEFRNKFESSSPEWGQGVIRPGDPLPYIPKTQASLSVGIKFRKWFLQSFFKYQSNSFDQALDFNRKVIPSWSSIDITGQYTWASNRVFYLKVTNLLNRQYLVSYRPFGARPGLPLTVKAGADWLF